MRGDFVQIFQAWTLARKLPYHVTHAFFVLIVSADSHLQQMSRRRNCKRAHICAHYVYSASDTAKGICFQGGSEISKNKGMFVARGQQLGQLRSSLVQRAKPQRSRSEAGDDPSRKTWRVPIVQGVSSEAAAMPTDPKMNSFESCTPASRPILRLARQMGLEVQGFVAPRKRPGCNPMHDSKAAGDRYNRLVIEL